MVRDRGIARMEWGRLPQVEDARAHRRRADLALALLLAAVLAAAWTANAWGTLAWLVLPDNDDMMRLQQVRDWIAGQGFNDWTQHRLAPPAGGPMHWSRINDIGPAALLLLARPLLGQHGAEVAMAIAYPALLFAAYLYLSARIGRRLHGDAAGPVAAVIAACAYPAHSLFLPGRIDHHALQDVLLLAAALALTVRPTTRAGMAAGVAVALSFGIGLETAPAVIALLGAQFGLWVAHGARERARLLGFAAGLAGVTALLLAFARPTSWSAMWCDAFTPASSAAALLAAGLLAGFALVRSDDWRVRLAVGGVAGAVGGAALLLAFPTCLSGPYGPMDPVVRQLFMDNVIEATGNWARRTPGWGLPNAGVMIVATAAAGWLLAIRRVGWPTLLPIAAVLLSADVVLLAQARGSYVGSAVAAPILAGLVVAARAAPRGGAWKLPAAWIASTGILWLVVPSWLDAKLQAQPAGAPVLAGPPTAVTDCRAGRNWQALGRYPAGTIMAAMDMAPYALAGTHHAIVAAGYHRSNAGNAAMYAFFLSPPERARAIGTEWSTDYVLLCPTDFSELDVGARHPGSLAARLLANRPPEWLRRVPLTDTGLRLYRVRR